MINKIWSLFIIIGITYSLFTGNIELINKEIIKSAEQSFNLIISIFPVMALWLGIMKIATTSGLLNKISTFLYPITKLLFKDIPKNHESISLITTTVIMNTFGLGNAATPIGLKAMNSLQTLNKNKEEATSSMITFLVLNTTGLTIIPTTIISLKMMYQSNTPTDIILPCFIASLISTICGLVIDKLYQRKENK